MPSLGGLPQRKERDGIRTPVATSCSLIRIPRVAFPHVSLPLGGFPQRKERDGIRTRDHRIRSPTLCPTELRALDAHKPSLQEKRIGFYPSNRYSDVTAGSRLSIQMPTGRPMIVSVNSTATFAQTQLSHQPTNTK